MGMSRNSLLYELVGMMMRLREKGKNELLRFPNIYVLEMKEEYIYFGCINNINNLTK